MPSHLVAAGGGVVDPIFQMVLVAPLMVQPGPAHAGGLALGVVGAAVALEIPGAGPKFQGPVLGQVVHQALPYKAGPAAVMEHQRLMAGDGFEMSPGMHGDRLRSFLYCILSPAIPQGEKEHRFVKTTIAKGQNL